MKNLTNSFPSEHRVNTRCLSTHLIILLVCVYVCVFVGLREHEQQFVLTLFRLASLFFV